MCGARLIRLQCYEGIDESKALYEWNYKKQLLRIQAESHTWDEVSDDIFSEEFLLTRPLLEAIRAHRPRGAADRRGGTAWKVETEALLLEILSGLPGVDPRARHRRGHADPPGVPHLQQHPRAVRGPEAALPLPLHRTIRTSTASARSLLAKVPDISEGPGRRGGPASCGRSGSWN